MLPRRHRRLASCLVAAAVLLCAILAQSLAHPARADPPLRRQKRLVPALGCATVFSCLGTFVKIVPIRFGVNLLKISDRMHGVDGYTMKEWHRLQSLRQRYRILTELDPAEDKAHAARVALERARISAMLDEEDDSTENSTP